MQETTILARFPIHRCSESAWEGLRLRRLSRARGRLEEELGIPWPEISGERRRQVEGRWPSLAWAANAVVGLVEIVALAPGQVCADLYLARRAFPRASAIHRWTRPRQGDEQLLFARLGPLLVMEGNNISYREAVAELVGEARNRVRREGCGVRRALVTTDPPGLKAFDFVAAIESHG